MSLDGRLLDEFTEGINAPNGPEDAGKFARVNSAGTNIEYVPSSEALVGDGVLAQALAPHLAGEHLTVDDDEKLALNVSSAAGEHLTVDDDEKLAVNVGDPLAEALAPHLAGDHLTVDDDGKLALDVGDAVAAALAAHLAGTHLKEDSGKLAVDIGTALGAALAPHLRGVGLTADGGVLSPRPRARRVAAVDHFFTGGLTTGTIGKLGWGLSTSGTGSALTALTGAVGSTAKLQLASGGASGRYCSLYLGRSSSETVASLQSLSWLQIVGQAFGGTRADSQWFFGLTTDLEADPTGVANCVGFIRQGTGNWSYLVRNGSSGDPVSLGVSSSDASTMFTMRFSDGGATVRFYIDSTLVATVGSGLPTASTARAVGVQQRTTGGSNSRGFWLSAMGFEYQPLTGAFDDDSFLES